MTRSLFPAFLPLFVVFLVVVMRRPARLLKRRGAVSLETAQPMADLKPGDEARLHRLVNQGVVRETPDGRYYYDAAGQRALMRARMPLLVTLLVALFAGSILLGWWLGRRTPAPTPANQVQAAT
jgi:hypothetical protein